MSVEGKVFQLSDARKEKQENLRREYERVLFNKLLGCYTVIEKLGLKSVELVDVSKSGCSFRMPTADGTYRMGEEIALRLYFSNKTYLPTNLTIRRVTNVVENGLSYNQYGCEFDSTLSTHPALMSFVEFVEKYSQHASEDKGDKQVWYL